MRLHRFRLRTLMIAVAIVALLLPVGILAWRALMQVDDGHGHQH